MKTNARTWLKSQSVKLEFAFLAIFGACGYTDTSPRTVVRTTLNSFRDTMNSSWVCKGFVGRVPRNFVGL